MSNIVTVGTFYPRRLSEYCPAMTYASDVHLGGARINFGAPALGSAAAILSATSVSAAGSTTITLLTNNQVADLWGRNLQVVLSGAGTGTVIIDGYDYLGQPMSENVALNGTTPVLLNKAFKTIRQVTWPTVGAVTMNLGTSAKLGLPYRAIKVNTEEANSGPVPAGTLTSPDLTDPATATTGDTRGTYTPTTTLNGSTVITATFEFANDVNSNGNGGLHGLPHYSN